MDEWAAVRHVPQTAGPDLTAGEVDWLTAYPERCVGCGHRFCFHSQIVPGVWICLVEPCECHRRDHPVLASAGLRGRLST